MLTILIYNVYTYFQCLIIFNRSTRRTGSCRRVLRRSVLRAAGTADCGTAEQHCLQVSAAPKSMQQQASEQLDE